MSVAEAAHRPAHAGRAVKLWLAFLVLIGTNLVAEGLGRHIPKGYTYFAMFFSFAVEMVNLRVRAKERDVVKLHDTPRADEAISMSRDA